MLSKFWVIQNGFQLAQVEFFGETCFIIVIHSTDADSTKVDPALLAVNPVTETYLAHEDHSIILSQIITRNMFEDLISNGWDVLIEKGGPFS
jgi:hypothetical protein